MTFTHLIGISGSLRAGSLNTALLRAAFEDLPDGVTAEVVSITDIPLYNADDVTDGTMPAPVVALRSVVDRADGIVFATPEYNWSVTGAMKNAVDWLSLGPGSPLDFKPAAIIGAGGGSGTARSQKHLRDVLSHNSLCIVADPQVMVARAFQRFDGTGLNDDGVRAELKAMLGRLVEVIDRSRSVGRVEARGSVLVVGSEEPRLDIAVRGVVEHGYRTLAAFAPVDAERILGRRSVAAVAVDVHLRDAAVATVRAAVGDTPIVEFDDPSSAGRMIDDALRLATKSE
ncbi:MAG: NAD(P)H-dependent oxidoreductase [Acidimicrobiia bacterium]